MLNIRRQYTGLIVGTLLLGSSIVLYRTFGLKVSFMEKCYAYLAYPLLQLQARCIAPCKHFFEERRSANQLYRELQEATQERQVLRAHLIELQATLLYSEQIKELADFRKQFGPHEGKLTHVLAHCCSEREHYLLVDIGSHQGITTDMVVTYKNCLIGRVHEVYPTYSKVILITDKSCKVAAQCCNTMTSGIHVGTNGTYTYLQRISHLSPVEIGDLVLSSGEGLIFPQGFGLGLVDEVAIQGLYKLVRIRPLIDPCSLSYCTIVQKGDRLNMSSHVQQREQVLRGEMHHARE
jgi:rod shape-determining protein MreC